MLSISVKQRIPHPQGRGVLSKAMRLQGSGWSSFHGTDSHRTGGQDELWCTQVGSVPFGSVHRVPKLTTSQCSLSLYGYCHPESIHPSISSSTQISRMSGSILSRTCAVHLCVLSCLSGDSCVGARVGREPAELMAVCFQWYLLYKTC